MANTDVSGQLNTAGMAFGDLVRLTGQAVANTQQELNKTAADSTSALATTLVDVIAVQEVEYDDAGTVTGAQTFTQKLPLIDVVDPVLYQWSQVRLQGRFTASQFATTQSSDSYVHHSTRLARSGRHRADLRRRLQQLPVRRLAGARGHELPHRELGRADADERHPRAPPRHRGAEAAPGDRRAVDQRRRRADHRRRWPPGDVADDGGGPHLRERRRRPHRRRRRSRSTRPASPGSTWAAWTRPMRTGS